MRTRRAPASAARDAFFKASRGSVSHALAAYERCEVKDGYMLSTLVNLVTRYEPAKRAERLGMLWATLAKRDGQTGSSVPELDAHLSSDFIKGYGSTGQLRMARRVLNAARDANLGSTRVYNSYLRACEHTSRGEQSFAVDEAAELLARMEGADKSFAPVDAFTLSLAAGVLGRAGRVRDAADLVERARGVADTVSLNALIAAAARAGDLDTALTTLQRMEDFGPPPVREPKAASSLREPKAASSLREPKAASSLPAPPPTVRRPTCPPPPSNLWLLIPRCAGRLLVLERPPCNRHRHERTGALRALRWWALLPLHSPCVARTRPARCRPRVARADGGARH